MKKIFVFVCFMFLWHDISAQSLLDVYKKGVVKLTPDTEYAQGNSWEKVFESYYDSIYNAPNSIYNIPLGNRKSLILMPNGSVVVNHAYRNYYSLFDANGKFVKEFGITGSSGKQLPKVNAVEGIINNNFFTGLDNMGKMVCFDFSGNYVKSLTLDYMAKQMIPMTNNKIAVVGWAIWKDRFRDFVAIVDYQTNEQKIIWEHFTNRSDKKNQDESSNANLPFSPPTIAFANDRLIVALPQSGEILIYDVNGKQISKDRIEWTQKFVSVEEQKKNIKRDIEKYSYERKKLIESGETKNRKLFLLEFMLKSMGDNLDNITNPKPIPLFANIITDSDGNLLFFEIPESEGANKFNVWVYQNGGKFVCQSSFVCDDYDLSITPSKMVFHKGYIYALQTLKNVDGNPLRLVRFKVGN